MNKQDVVAFFDSRAKLWDANMIKYQSAVDKILDLADVTEGKTVLDVACGTGVLIPDYISRGVNTCVGIDISPEMLNIAKNKFKDYKNLRFVCGDAENFVFNTQFDCIMIYNAFPHFVNPEKLFKNLSLCLKKGGRITVSHGMSREAILMHHSGEAEKVSLILPQVDELKRVMEQYFNVDIWASTDELYIASGLKK